MHVLGAQKNCLIEMVLFSTHNIRFVCELRKIIFKCTLLSGGLVYDILINCRWKSYKWDRPIFFATELITLWCTIPSINGSRSKFLWCISHNAQFSSAKVEHKYFNSRNKSALPQIKFILETIFLKQHVCVVEQYVSKTLSLLEVFFCLFVLLLYVPSQQLWSWWDGQFT